MQYTDIFVTARMWGSLGPGRSAPSPVAAPLTFFAKEPDIYFRFVLFSEWVSAVIRSVALALPESFACRAALFLSLFSHLSVKGLFGEVSHLFLPFERRSVLDFIR